jgi:hypothetical protein
MAGSMADFLEDELLDHVLKNLSYSPPATIYVALFTAPGPTDAGPGANEVAVGGYARQTAAFDVSSGGATANSAIVTWTASGAAYGTVVAFALMDAVSAGNMLFWADLDTSRVVNDGDTCEFAAGDLAITLD